MAKYEYLLFDADGTLYDFTITEKNAINWTWKMYNIPYNDETISCFKRHNSHAWSQIEEGTLTIEELKYIRFEWTFKELGLDIDPKKFAKDFIANVAKTGEMFPKSLAVLTELKKRGYKIYIITNGISVVQHSRFNKPETQDIYEKIFCGEDIGVSKPKIEFFDKVFSEIGINGSNKCKSIVIGDSLTSDIQGGINAGLETIWYNPKKLSNDQKIEPTHEIHDLEQLLDFFPSINQ